MRSLLLGMLGVLAAGSCFCARSHEWEGCRAPKPSAGFEMEIISEGRRLPVYHVGHQRFIEGRVGERYVVRVSNRSDRRVEVLISVDGRDAIDGRPASFAKRGYIIPAHSSIGVDGFRLSMREVAAFRFSVAEGSYAAQTGTPWTVGVVSVAFFPEYAPCPPSDPHPPYETRTDNRADLGSPSGRSSESGDRAGEKAASPSNLGTGFGERRSSPVTETSFARENWSNPALQLSLRYDDREGLCTIGIGELCPPPYCSCPRPVAPFPDNRFSTPPPLWEHFTMWY
jgi:hypothetical protein